MYYSAKAANGAIAIGLATSPDLVTWTKYGSGPLGGTSFGSGLADPCVIKIGSQYVMYTAYNYSGGNEFLYFTSGDGINWTYQGIFFGPPISTDWDYGKSGWFEGYVFKNRLGFFELMYVCNDSGTGAQHGGYAVSPDGFNFYKYNAEIILPTSNNSVGNMLLREYAGQTYLFSDIYNFNNNTGEVGTYTFPLI
jgi:hypothetical protein